MTPKTDAELSEEMAFYATEPLLFVKDCYCWKQPGTPLEDDIGPDDNQIEFLTSLRDEVKKRGFDGITGVRPIRMAISKGHGTGGSTLGAWLVNWIMSTRPNSIGTVTAGTAAQLESRTWAAIQKWTALCATRKWWEVQSDVVYAREHILGPGMTKQNWKVVASTCKQENAQSFAGQHAKGSTSYYLMDEASRVPDGIYKVAYGGLVSAGENMMFCFGQMERNTGEFYEMCFGKSRDRWNHRTTDSRTSRFADKELIAEWEHDMGASSDWFRVRVLGLAPKQSELQYIDTARVEEAQQRKVSPLADDPLIIGCDVSGGGAAWSVIRFRRGLDARSIPPIRIPGDMGREREVLITKLASLLQETSREKRVAMVFIDSAFGSPIVERLHVLGFSNVIEVAFGGRSPDHHCKNMRAYMHKEMKEWLLRGAIDPEDKRLASDLVAPGASINQQSKLVIEPKADVAKRLGHSSDDSDALCLEAGTMVRTPLGERPIESLRVGDLVTTPFGDSEVAICHVSETNNITTANFSNRARLSGKGEHKVFTFSSGEKRLDALTLTDEVDIFSRWRLLLWRLVSLSFIGARSFGFKQLEHTFSRGGTRRRRDFFIVGCGLTITALSQRVTRFITRMMTGAITSLATLSLSPLDLTSASTCGDAWPSQENLTSSCKGWTLPESRPQNGTVLQKESRGIVSTGSELGRIGRQQRLSAHDAELSMTRFSSQGADHALRSIAHPPAHKPFRSAPISQKPESVHFAALTSWPIAIAQRSSVRARALLGRLGLTESSWRLARAPFAAIRSVWKRSTQTFSVVPVDVQTESVSPTLVYNLTLREHNAYYANGILVFNCLTFAQPVGPVFVDDNSDRDYYSSRRPASPDGWMA